MQRLENRMYCYIADFFSISNSALHFYILPNMWIIWQEIPYHLERMEFGTELDGTQDFFQMFWPITVSHKIDEDSPLWEMSARYVHEAKVITPVFKKIKVIHGIQM